MKREIKFRARLLDSKKWVYGSLIQESLRYGSRFSILTLAEDEESEDEKHEVYFPTVGQFTGLRDKNGKEIYEGDVVANVGIEPHVIQWNKSGYWEAHNTQKNDYGYTGRALFLMHEFPSIEVIGNIYENPELLRSASGIEADTQ